MSLGGLHLEGLIFGNLRYLLELEKKNYLFICWYFFSGHYRSESTKLAKVVLCFSKRETRSHKGLSELPILTSALLEQ